MTLAYVTESGRGMTDTLIGEIVRALASDGVRLAGTVRSSPVDPNAHPCDMDLRVLPDGPEFRISQPRGRAARGCRLDGGIVETIAVEVEARLAAADVLIVNKFGKQEAQGRGLCPAILMATELGLPTVVGVNDMNAPLFECFSGGVAVALPPDLRAVCAWVRHALAHGALVTA